MFSVLMYSADLCFLEKGSTFFTCSLFLCIYTSGVREGVLIISDLDETHQNACLGQGLPQTPMDYHHGDQGGPRERGLGGALHVGYYDICFPIYAPNSTKFGMTTERDKDNRDPPRTTIMEDKGDLESVDKEGLYMEEIGPSIS